VDHHPTVKIIPDFTCTIPAAVPVADVPTPYSVNTEIYANLSTINFTLTVSSNSQNLIGVSLKEIVSDCM